MKKVFLILTFAIHLFGSNLFLNQFFNDNQCDQILHNNGYFETCYSYRNKGAKFVAYSLDGSKVNSINIKKRPRFYEDLHIPKQFRSTYSDYTRNIYHQDRGHLCPDAAKDWSRQSLHSIYVLSNIIPQYYLINRGKHYWAGVERYARYTAKKLGSVNILNGVIYGAHPKRIGHNQIAVPKAYWKMVYSKKNNFQKCFYFENNKNFILDKKSIKDFVVNCNSLLLNKRSF